MSSIRSVLSSTLVSLLLPASMSLVVTGCFKGAEREKKAPPGVVGGLCLAPDGTCNEGECNRDRNYCYDPVDPCVGFFCGGSDRGICMPDSDGQPRCACAPGFQNRTFELYCCPEDGIGDPDCVAAEDSGDEEGDSEGDSESDGEAESSSEGG